MSTQLEAAWRGTVTPEMEAVARVEGVSPGELRERIARGEAVILKNRVREIAPVGIGKGLRTKVNANVGTPPEAPDPDLELRKAVAAWRAGADTLMDLSLGGDLRAIRRRIMAEVPLPLGTVPVYQVAMEALGREGTVVAYTADELLAAIEDQAREGVDFMTVHCGVTRRVLPLLERSRRLTGVVSRGGALHIDWMVQHGEENPLYARFDDLLEIARSHDVVLSLGDGLRPGSLADAGDPLQMAELLALGELVERAREAGVQVMVEGPGHVPLPEIEAQVRAAKSICRGAPFYVLGPLPTDIVAGYDHIAAAVGGALAAWAGADFLCYVTPAEHLGVPTEEEVRIGVIAARIAAHIADVAVLPGARLRDERMSRARGRLDWEGMAREALDPGPVRERAQAPEGGPCALCGELCPMSARRTYRELIEGGKGTR